MKSDTLTLVIIAGAAIGAYFLINGFKKKVDEVVQGTQDFFSPQKFGSGIITAPTPAAETPGFFSSGLDWLNYLTRTQPTGISEPTIPIVQTFETPLQTQQRAAAFVAGEQAKAAAKPSPIAQMIRVPSDISRPAVAYVSQPVGIMAKIPSTVPGFQTGGGMLFGLLRSRGLA